MAIQSVKLAEYTSPSVSSYTQVVGASTYSTPGIVHKIIPVSAAGSATPPGLLYDGSVTNGVVNGQIIGVIPANQAVGNVIDIDAPFQKGLVVAPSAGQALIVTYSQGMQQNM